MFPKFCDKFITIKSKNNRHYKLPPPSSTSSEGVNQALKINRHALPDVDVMIKMKKLFLSSESFHAQGHAKDWKCAFLRKKIEHKRNGNIKRNN